MTETVGGRSVRDTFDRPLLSSRMGEADSGQRGRRKNTPLGPPSRPLELFGARSGFTLYDGSRQFAMSLRCGI